MPPIFRHATLDDAAQVQAIYAPYCYTPISFELEPPSVAEMKLRMTKILGLYPWLVCEDDGAIVGYVYASSHRERAAYRWSVDTTVYLQQQRHRRGMGRALYTALFKMLSLQGYVNAFAGVTLPNPSSEGLHSAMGFQPIGVYRQVGYKYGAWHDVIWYQLHLQPHPGEPPPPKSLAEVRHMPECEAALHAGLRLLRG